MPHCIIVGAGPGLGEAIARTFGQQDHRISLIARKETSLREQSERLAAARVTSRCWVCDASDAHSLRQTIVESEAENGPCSALIYNAAVLRPESPLGLGIDTAREEFNVNLVGALAAAQTVAPGMVERGNGAILFTGGGLALEPYPEWTSLALGKAALRSLSFSLYKELSPRDVHVSVIAVCGIVAPGGPFDPEAIAAEYYRLATAPNGIEDRELIFQPDGTDAYYNDPNRVHAATTIPPLHVR